MKNKIGLPWIEIVSIVVIVGLFTWLRFAHLSQSLLFFGDFGRDFFMLQQWQMTGKPPLLGPQTSALPFNQSALYFYILYPFFLVLNHSMYSTIIASWFYHLVVFSAGIYFLRRHHHLRQVWLVSWLLMAIQPQYVIQHRYIWNPSFVGMCLLAAYMAFELLIKKFTYPRLIVFALSLAAATAFSYSAIPVLLAFGVLSLIYLRKEVIKLGAALAASLAVVNLPTIAFEIRHGFVLTKLMLYGEKLTQSGIDLPTKLANLEQFIISGPNHLWNLAWLSLILLVIGWVSYHKISTKISWSGLLADRFIRASILLIITLSLLLVLPISLHAHYIFGLVTTIFILIGLLPGRLSLLVVTASALLWLQPAQLNSYFSPAFRTPEQTLACARQVCQSLTEPLFVSVQAGYHPYHNGFEFKYVLKENGCTVYDIETEPNRAEYMAVFSDRSQYEHGKTAYNELTQFGSSTEISQISCEGQMKVHILQRQ